MFPSESVVGIILENHPPREKKRLRALVSNRGKCLGYQVKESGEWRVQEGPSMFHCPGPGLRGTSGFPLSIAEAPKSRWLLGSGRVVSRGVSWAGSGRRAEGEWSALLPDVALPRRPTPTAPRRSKHRATSGIWHEPRGSSLFIAGRGRPACTAD